MVWMGYLSLIDLIKIIFCILQLNLMGNFMENDNGKNDQLACSSNKNRVSDRRSLLRNLGAVSLGVLTVDTLVDSKKAEATTLAAQTIISVESVSVLKSAGFIASLPSPPTDGQQFELLGYYGKNEVVNGVTVNGRGKGGGIVYYDAGAVDANNDVTVFVNGVYKFKRRTAAINFYDAGAIGDNVVDDAAAIQRALNAATHVTHVNVPDATFLVGSPLNVTGPLKLSGYGVIRTLADTLFNVTYNSCQFSDFTVIGNYSCGFIVNGDDTEFNNITFNGGAQCILLKTTQRTLIRNCIFSNNIYGVIVQSGFSSDYGSVIGCTFNSMKACCINLNSQTQYGTGWVVSGNELTGFLNYPAPATEGRFISATKTRNLIISNNIINKVCGDAAIHLEDLGSDCVITGNIISDCQVSGQLGMIYILNTEKHVVISNNIIKKADHELQSSYAICSSSGAYAVQLTIVGNRFVAYNNASLSGINVAELLGSAVIEGNTFDTLVQGIETSKANNLNITGNNFIRCGYGIKSTEGSSSGGSNNSVFSNNVFKATGTACIKEQRNTSGTAPSTNVIISGNVFDQAVSLTDAVEVLITGNTFPTSQNVSLAGLMPTYYIGPARCTVINNMKQGTGFVA